MSEFLEAEGYQSWNSVVSQ